MMKNSRGMILVIVLLLISLIDALILTGFSLLEEEIRLSKNFYSFSKQEANLSLILKNLYPIVTSGKWSCFIPKPLTVSEWLQKTDDWWFSSETCSLVFHEITVRYAIETLDADPCASLGFQKWAQYFRVTLKAALLKRKESWPIIQLTFVLPISTEEHCKGSVRQLSDTWQSWREL